MPTAKLENSKQPKIGVREAAEAAVEYFCKLFPTVTSFSLEEVELSEDEKEWHITLSFEIPGYEKSTSSWAKSVNFQELFGTPRAKYKLFKVDAKTGEVRAMKIRSFE